MTDETGRRMTRDVMLSHQTELSDEIGKRPR